MNFTIATDLDHALAAVASGDRPIAGGSDLVVAARHGKAPLPASMVAIDRVPELQSIDASPAGVRIGATVNHARLMSEPMLVRSYSALCDAAALIGSPATRNVGTIGGNIMNASPAMDTGAPLIVLGAQVELRSQSHTRLVSPAELWTGPGSTSAALDELCTSVLLPPPSDGSGSAYVRLEYRRAMEIAVVGAAAWVQLNREGGILRARVALTAVGPTIIEVQSVDHLVAGWALSHESLDALAQAAAEQAQPISDMRASDEYRRHTVGVMARRAMMAAVRRASGEEVPVPVNRSLGIGA